MNEIELIRTQLATERRHAVEVAQACATALAGGAVLSGQAPQDFRQVSVDYLVWILSRFEEREQVFRELLHSRLAGDDPARRALDLALALPGTSRETLTKLEAALSSTPIAAAGAASLADAGVRGRVGPGDGAVAGGHASDATQQHWPEFLRFFSGPWSTRRDQLDKLLEAEAKVADWRTVAGIDADSIFEERSRYTRVRSALPAGVEMPLSAARS